MADFTITYSFVAIDEFTKTAAKIKAEIASIQESLASMAQMSGVAQDAIATMGVVSNKTVATLNDMAVIPNLSKTKQDLNGLTKNYKAQNDAVFGLGKNVDKLNESTAAIVRAPRTRAAGINLFSLMNMVLPMAFLAREGFKYNEQMQNAQVAISTQFDKNQDQLDVHKKINQEVEKYSKITRFSAPQLMQAVSVMATMTGNIGVAEATLKNLIGAAIVTGQKDIPAFAKTYISGIASGKIPGMNIKLTAATTYGRWLQMQMQVAQKTKGAITGAEGLPSTQFYEAAHVLQKSLGEINVALTPLITILAVQLKNFSEWLDPLIREHQRYVQVLGALIGASILFLGVELLFMNVFKMFALVIGTITKVLEAVGLVKAGRAAGIFRAGKAGDIGEVLAMIGSKFFLLGGIVGLLAFAFYELYKHIPAVKKYADTVATSVAHAVTHPIKTAEGIGSVIKHVGFEKFMLMMLTGGKVGTNFPPDWVNINMGAAHHKVDVAIHVKDSGGYVSHVGASSSTANTYAKLGPNMPHELDYIFGHH